MRGGVGYDVGYEVGEKRVVFGFIRKVELMLLVDGFDLG